jgi:hypothetical protein
VDTTLAILLLVNALFNFIVWPRFIRRIASDTRARDEHGKRTAFFTVHMVLITLALILALISAVAAIIALTI